MEVALFNFIKTPKDMDKDDVDFIHLLSKALIVVEGVILLNKPTEVTLRAYEFEGEPISKFTERWKQCTDVSILSKNICDTNGETLRGHVFTDLKPISYEKNSILSEIADAGNKTVELGVIDIKCSCVVKDLDNLGGN